MTLVRPKSQFSYGKVRVAFRLHILTEYRMDMQERSLFLKIMAAYRLDNPFPEYGYFGPEYFCDREQETEQLTEALLNGSNIQGIR